ncbi:MAG: histidinol-phosphatase [Bacteroidetes bacterium]|nr:histidinol-phosphatase [Bacteroidota bacterium]MBU1680958.1 histidinol-phosphatase [Bacteroidota bacterium]MBU2506124.1 histidinol-phosphatase [Bacteroidota bacterium]
MFEYVGAVHIHSIYSDGSGRIDEIAQFANEVDLDFIIMTDHNTLRPLDEGFEGWYGNTFVLIGCEINDKENQNHYIALGIEKTFSTRLPAKEYVKKIKESGGIGFLAHPHESRTSMKEHPAYPWTEWDTSDFTGIEIWNHMSEWMEGLTEQNKYNYFVHPLRSIVGPQEKTLRLWDDLSLERKVVGIGGIDAHAHRVNLLGFFEVEVFPYKILFKSIRTHVLTEKKIDTAKTSKKNAKKLILNSLEKGQCFFSNYYRADAKGFRFFAQESKKVYQMGETIPFSNQIYLKVILPNISGTIRFIRNGELADTVENSGAEFLVSQIGVYRIEVYLEGLPWIYSNHIRIGV